ncbi:hypothetical protein MLD38_016281 [Melastoma candidum]|uniref:Uncharacterized protein n=1 Tax=Melastoma candidum TaxID=119954 RepID=A0ACB9RK76_9MYRT|nr:hypothetical protein MLD38_016281 [Melastoma candidum]
MKEYIGSMNSLAFCRASFALLLVAASAYAQLEGRTITRWETGMGGPGSWPPSCRWMCGRCSPCVAVHVPVQPGRARRPTEYYPEAWRCKCGGKLYMP